MGRLKILGGLLSITVAFSVFLSIPYIGFPLDNFGVISFVIFLTLIPAAPALLGGILGIASKAKASIVLTWITVGYYTVLIIISIITSTPMLFESTPISLSSQWGVAIIIAPANIHIPLEYLLILLGAILLIVGRNKRIKR